MTANLNSSIPAIEAMDLSIGYNEKAVLSNLNFRIRYDEITAVLGSSGCGKSTLLKTLIGLIPVLKGDILIDGESIVHCSFEEKSRILRKFGTAFQSGALFRSYTLEENVALPMEEYTTLSPKEIRQKVREKLAIVGLAGHEKKMPGELSGGMVKRAAMARAMALDPKILFLDEPSAGLDPITSRNLDQLILQLKQQFHSAVVIVTHELESLLTVADRAIFLGRGTILEDGDPRELKQHAGENFVRAFLNRDPSLDTGKQGVNANAVR